MAANVDNVKLGICDVTLGGSDIGHTKGGVELSITPDIHSVTVDKYGSSVVKAYEIGTAVEVKITCAEYQKDLIAKAIAGSTLTAGSTKDQIGIGGTAGKELTASAMVLHPTAFGTSTDDDITLHKVIPMGTMLPFKVEEETVYEATFMALIDESQTDGEMIARFGTAD